MLLMKYSQVYLILPLLITVSDAALADINNLPMHTEGTPHAFFVGQPSVGCTIENVSGTMSPGGTGTFQVIWKILRQ